MKDFLNRLLFLRPPGATLPTAPGLYHIMHEVEGKYTRFHVRVEGDSSGMLIANATAAARLSPTGVLIARKVLDGADDEVILRELATHFRDAAPDRMRNDIQQVRNLVGRLANPGDSHPIINFEDPSLSPRPANLIAPWQANVPLAAPEQMLPLLDRLWEVGIPHVMILAPTNLDVSALLRAIERAEDIGMIAGVRGRGSDLQPVTLLRDMAMAGVDYITLPYASAQADIHDELYGIGDYTTTNQVITALLEYEVCPVAEVPLIEITVPGLHSTLDTLVAMDVRNVSFFAIAAPNESQPDQRSGALTASALLQVATLIEEMAHDLVVRYIWQPPVLRNAALPLAVQVQQGPRCSGEVAVRVEPDGSVIPPRGAYRSAGNVLHDSWDSIWHNAAFRSYRERVEAPTRCAVCPGLALCAADCPAEQAGWTQK